MKKLLFLTLTSAAVVLSSCLKDKEVEDRVYGLDGIQDTKLIELSLTPLTTDNYQQLAMEAKNGDTTIALVPITFAYKEPAQEDINVVLVANNSLIGNYNALNGKMHEPAPLGLYAIQNPVNANGEITVTIPRGERKGYLMVKLNPNNFLGHDYALAFQIARVENPGYVISSNFATAIVAIGIKNKYDGIYTLRSRQFDWLAYNIINTTWDWPASYGISMITSGANSVNMYSSAHSSYIHPAISTTNYTGFGSTNPRFVFDVATNKLTNVVNDFAGSTRVFLLNPAVTDSRYDPASKKIFAAFLMRQPGRPDLQIFDTLTYVKAR